MRFEPCASYLSKTVNIVLNFIIIIFCIRFFILEPGKVNGQSMEPTFSDNNFFLINKTVYLFSLPKRYDIIQIINPNNRDQLFLKRIIGLPGETIIFQRGKVSIIQKSGEKIQLKESYLFSDVSTQLPYGMNNSIFIPEDYYFVLGDNRFYSNDSREFGSIHRRLINGKVSSF